jgi:very-short-patch-repair endonuclease
LPRITALPLMRLGQSRTREEGTVKARGITRRRAQSMRRELTDAERILWSRLKGRQLRGYQFRAQHPVEPYILDFACTRLKLAVELDGATHGSPDAIAYDAHRRAYLEAEGWRVLRFWNADVYENLNGVLESILQHLPRQQTPPPS